MALGHFVFAVIRRVLVRSQSGLFVRSRSNCFFQNVFPKSIVIVAPKWMNVPKTTVGQTAAGGQRRLWIRGRSIIGPKTNDDPNKRIDPDIIIDPKTVSGQRLTAV